MSNLETSISKLCDKVVALEAKLAAVEAERDGLREDLSDADTLLGEGAVEIAKLRTELTVLRQAAEGAKAFVLAHEAWEAKLIVDGNWGLDGMDPLPKFTWPIYDEFMEVQAKRNAVKETLTAALTPAANEAKKVSSEQFAEHCERASEIVATWPEWKRNALGTESKGT